MINKTKTYWLVILIPAIIKFILPFIVQSPVFELQRDEFLYYQQGQHLALGYLENPPLLSYMAAISSWLGGSIFWIKFWPAIIGAGTVIVTGSLAAQLGGKKFAQLLAGLAVCSGAYVRTHALFQPNVLDIFSWTLSVYFIVCYINEQQTKFLYWFAISIALGFWGKYSVLFIAAGLVAGLLLTQHRKIFAEKKLYAAALISVLIILPNVWWQYAHNWPLVHHMKELQETQLKFGNPLDFLKEQLMMLFPVLIIWIAGLTWFLRKKQWLFLGYTYFIILLLLILGRGKSYYALGIYPMLLAAGAVAWEQLTQKRIWIRYVVCIFIIGFTFLILPLLLPTRTPEKLAAFYKKIDMKNKWEDQKDHPLPQDFADMLGWKELTKKTEHAFYIGLPDTARCCTIIYCDHYGQAGALKFYSEHADFRNRVVTDNGSFLLWMPDTLSFKHLMWVIEKMPKEDNKVFSYFESYRIMDSVTDPLSRQFGNKILFFENAKPGAVEFFNTIMDKEKKEFTRK
jgi:hypothetical protein